jgi:hypothetical protein
MRFNFAILTRSLLIVGVALAYSAQAQPSERRPGEAIIFSSPDDDGVSSNMPSLAAKPPVLLEMANAIQSPAVKFGDSSEAAPLPESQPPAISPAQVQQMQRLLDERKNWALLTPEEILGLPTQEKILGIPERDASGQPKNEPVMARYYERQEQSQARTNNDYFGVPDSTPRGDSSDDQEIPMNAYIWTPTSSSPGNSALMDQFLSGTPDGRAASAQAPENGSMKPFDQPAPPPKDKSEQEAEMEQFQQLLQSHPPSGGAANAPALGGPIFSSSSTAPIPAPEQPTALIPVGASYTPLSSGIATPAGLTPLPGLLGPTNAALPVFAPEWKPQPPPWASSAPQLGVIPQRKF